MPDIQVIGDRSQKPDGLIGEEPLQIAVGMLQRQDEHTGYSGEKETIVHLPALHDGGVVQVILEHTKQSQAEEKTQKRAEQMCSVLRESRCKGTEPAGEESSQHTVGKNAQKRRKLVDQKGIGAALSRTGKKGEIQLGKNVQSHQV